MSLSNAVRPAGRLISLCLILLLAGCAATPQWPSPDTTPSSLHSRTVLADVPFYPQERYQCGPASLAMMLNSQGLNTDPERLRDQVYLPGREGSLQVEMVAAARAHNLLVYPLDGSLESLLREVAAGHPVLVMQNLLFDWWPQWHFAVVIGFDPAQRTIILHTDTRARHETPVEVFANTWARAGNWAAVMLPPEKLPATATALKYLASANDLESTGHLNAAMTAYQRAEQQWPDQPSAILGQGNVAYAQENLSGATAQFIRLVRQFPGEAIGWNNLAHTLHETGCEEAAAEAQRCAAALAPERFGTEINAQPTGRQGVHCSVPACPANASDRQ